MISLPVPVFPVSSCIMTEPMQVPDPPDMGAGTAEFRLSISNSCTWAGLGQTDLFIYSASGARILEKHVILPRASMDTTLSLTEGRKIVVAIANSRYGFNETALGKMDSMELLTYYYMDEDSGFPLMSAADTVSSSDNAKLELKPILCRVILDEVCNNLPEYGLLENPRIYMEDLNPSAEVLRSEGFRPTESLGRNDAATLPNDVGFYSQRPGTCLYCYPNDAPENVLGVARTSFVFECEIEGGTYRFSTELPPMKRESTVRLTLTVDSPYDFRYGISEDR